MLSVAAPELAVTDRVDSVLISGQAVANDMGVGGGDRKERCDGEELHIHVILF